VSSIIVKKTLFFQRSNITVSSTSLSKEHIKRHASFSLFSLVHTDSSQGCNNLQQKGEFLSQEMSFQQVKMGHYTHPLSSPGEIPN
jgi:hypothetical protein